MNPALRDHYLERPPALKDRNPAERKLNIQAYIFELGCQQVTCLQILFMTVGRSFKTGSTILYIPSHNSKVYILHRYGSEFLGQKNVITYICMYKYSIRNQHHNFEPKQITAMSTCRRKPQTQTMEIVHCHTPY